MKGKELARLAINNGWVEVRCRGSHHTFKHPRRADHLVIPWANTGREIDAGLVRQIIHQMRRGQHRVSC